MGLQEMIGRERAALLLMHPTALPDPGTLADGRAAAYGIGELGSQAHGLLDWLAAAGVLAWQVLPLGHTGYGNSPYQTFSRYAGSPYLLSVERLLEVGDLTPEAHDAYVRAVGHSGAGPRRADYGWLFRHKVGAGWEEGPEGLAVLRRAYLGAQARSGARLARFRAFCAEAAGWLEDYAQFMALKESHDHRPWSEWPAEERDVARWRAARDGRLGAEGTLARTVDFYRYTQFVFAEQWQDLRTHAHRAGRLLIGDIPWYVGYDSADVWAHPTLFDLDAAGRPLGLAGVPPDYFSRTGQLWGNPLYRWWDEGGALREEVLAWWADSLAHLLARVDVLRIDHLRAIDTYWSVPPDSPTAQRGVWAKGPGEGLLEALRGQLGVRQLPLIAEDLGYLEPVAPAAAAYPEGTAEDQRFEVSEHLRGLLTSEALVGRPEFSAESGVYRPRVAVDRLLAAYDLPWMGILHFAWEGEERFRPERVIENSVLYTGTHDNDTSLGWYLEQVRAETQSARDPLGQPVLGASRLDAYLASFSRHEQRLQRNVSWDMIEVALSTRSGLVGLPVADLLCLGAEARMNLPGDTSRPWWDWRALREELWAEDLAERLRGLLAHYGRLA